MKKRSLILTVCLAGAAAQAQLIDDFGVAGLGQYTLTRILDHEVAEANVSAPDASGALVASDVGTINQPEPSLAMLAGNGAVGLWFRLRRK